MFRTALFFIFIFLASCQFNSNKQSDEVLEKTVQTYENGTPHIIQLFKNGQAIYQKEFYADGKISMEGPLQNGKREGEWKSYYENGNLWSSGFFKDGILNGESKAYFPNGKLRYKGSFKNGEKTGTWIFYDENGNRTGQKDFGTPK